MKHQIALLLACVSSISTAAAAATAATFNTTDFDLLSVKREYFYAGGHYENITTNNVTSTYMVGQIYVEKLTPTSMTTTTNTTTTSPPIIFIAGAGQTGTNFLHTPDGRPGWAAYFLAHGITVYLTDQPQRGRSPWNPSSFSAGSLTSASPVATIEQYFTATQHYNLWPQAALHTQWPGTGLAGDATFDAFYASQVQMQLNQSLSEANSAAAYTALVDHIVADAGDGAQVVDILTHSQAGPYGWRVADLRPQKVRKVVAVEPAGPPFTAMPYGITTLGVSYEPSAVGPDGTVELATVTVPPTNGTAEEEGWLDSCVLQAEPAKKLVNVAEVEVLVVNSEASFHAPFEYCTVDYLRQAGVSVDWLDLPKAGIHGNGHMMFMELNNLEIADCILGWLTGGTECVYS